MGIAQKVARNFSDAVRSRGQSYFLKGRVTLMAARAGEVVARVRGPRNTGCGYGCEARSYLASCTLPVFQPAGGAVQAPLGDIATGRGSRAVPVAAGFSGASGRRRARAGR